MKEPYEPFHDEKKSIEDVPAAPEVHHELDSVVFGDQKPPNVRLYPELINQVPLVITQEIEARIIKALTGIGLTVATSTYAIESMRQEGITFTILSP